MIVIEKQDQRLFDRVQEQNLLRQYDLLTNCIEIGLQQEHIAFDKYMLWSLNHIAVANICQFGGRYRREPIYVARHIPPHFEEVPELMDRMISTIHENWFDWSATMIAAYALWRMLWIHPFIEGNGRTARATCYYLLCTKYGTLLGGRKSVPERIREDREPYYQALRAADSAWEAGHLDFNQLEEYLAGLVQAQLLDAS